MNWGNVLSYTKFGFSIVGFYEKLHKKTVHILVTCAVSNYDKRFLYINS